MARKIAGKIARKMYFNGRESIGINKGRPPANTKPPGIESRVKEPNDVIAGSRDNAETPRITKGGPKSLIASRNLLER